MARPTTISDEAILDAAREVFFERGQSATTAEIASRAGVSEGSIFKRWKTKEQLFFACMDSGRVEDTPWIRKLPSRVGTRTLRDNVEEIGIEMIHALRTLMPAILMRQGLGEIHRQNMASESSGPNVARARLAAYFDAERKLGRLRSVDVDVLARTFIGALFSYVHLEFVMAGHDPAPIAAETFVRSYVEIIVSCITPPRRAKR
jgi:AcrR family transcriptional regulator